MVMREWSVVMPSSDGYTAPELLRPMLKGLVDYHAKLAARGEFKPGDPILTSAIVGAEGRRITTESGSVYVLEGDPHAAYVAYCRDNKIPLDMQNPIKVRHE